MSRGRFAKYLEISQGRAASHEISDTSHFWLGQKYHKNNAASSLSMLALLFPHSRQGFVLPKILRAPDPPVPATALPNGADGVRLFFLLRPMRRERKIFLANKSSDSFVDLKNYFGTERAPRRRSPELMLAGDVLLGILNHHGLVGAEGTSQPRPPVSPLGL